MPTYEYMCENCEHKFEQFQSITAKPLRTCPKCKKRKLKRLIGTGAGVIFKGSGFYETDYRSENYKKARESEKKSAGKNTGKKDSETKSKSEDSKPDKKNKPTKDNKNKTA
jgi:putative FmdB family regulatory protein